MNKEFQGKVALVTGAAKNLGRVIAIALDGSFHCIKAALPHLIKAGDASIVTLSGDGALVGTAGKVNSTAAKMGLVGMTQALARELAEHGIRVNSVSPGAHQVRRGPRALGRKGSPDELAATVCFLCSKGAGYITGQTIHVNGGNFMSS